MNICLQSSKGVHRDFEGVIRAAPHVHMHPDEVVYFLQGGSAKIALPDGHAMEVEVKDDPRDPRRSCPDESSKRVNYGEPDCTKGRASRHWGSAFLVFSGIV